MTPVQAANKFESIPTDAGRWKWLISNPDLYKMVECDNDSTVVNFGEDSLGEIVTSDFDWYIGWPNGVFELLEAVGIKAESV